MTTFPLAAQQQSPADAPYLDSKLPVEQQVNDLVSRTLEAKASQLGRGSQAYEVHAYVHCLDNQASNYDESRGTVHETIGK